MENHADKNSLLGHVRKATTTPCNIFKPAKWITTDVDSESNQVLILEGEESGYLFGKGIKSSREGQFLVIAHAIRRRQDSNLQKAGDFSKGEQVIVKAFTNCTEAQKEAYLTRRACTDVTNCSKIVQLIDFIKDDKTFYIIQEFLPGGDLFERITSLGDVPVPASLAKTWYSDLLHGLLHLRKRRLAHMDISPENILLDENDHCKLIDFGLSIQLPRGHKSGQLYEGLPCCGKSSYMAPEVYRRTPYEPYAADIWSMGIVFYVIATGMPLYGAAGDRAFKALEDGYFDKLVDHYKSISCRVPEGPIRDIIRSMLHPNPSKRPSAEELLKKLS